MLTIQTGALSKKGARNQCKNVHREDRAWDADTDVTVGIIAALITVAVNIEGSKIVVATVGA